MPQLSPIRIAIRHAVLCASLGLGTIPCLTQAAEAGQTDMSHDLTLPAGSLDTALTALSRATGLNITFAQGDLAGKYTPGLQGRFSNDQALRQLLAGSGLHAVPQHNGGYHLVPIPDTPDNGAVALDPTDVVGARLGTTTEGTGSYTTGTTSIGGKTQKTLRETPQSVSVMTKQRMQDQNLTSLTQVLDQTTGITVVGGNDSKNEFYSRGFVIRSIQTDGGAPMFRNETYDSLPDMTAYDHVEVLRGSDGLYGGTGDPGGSINLVRKRALAYN
ncbi:TonB-dependent receptor [Pseudomonas sp. S32]|uniref:TonB-dependent receptor n=1 Tax=Pseudomonas sp. S32 TaxID=2767448 RepID=UPI00191293E7|nr:STN domain-containing protein [Pseudomonas sp. S32]MBK5007061.1 TonB-dependent siderophore receptor [Pseudomonas sp. S32]